MSRGEFVSTFKFFSILFLLVALLGSDAFAARSLRVLDAKDYGDDIERFYADCASEPVIVKNVYENHPLFSNLNPSIVEGLLSGIKLQTYKRSDENTGWKLFPVLAEAYFDEMRVGSQKYFILDQPLRGTPLEGQVEAPNVLKEDWLDSLKDAEGNPEFGLKITLSGKGSFTVFHEDGSGEQAWMYLVYGQKKWTIFPPSLRAALFDAQFKRFYDPRMSEAEKARYPFYQYIKDQAWEVTANGGDLILLPPGWVHQVDTSEESFGVGGNLVNGHQIDESVQTAMVERSHALKPDFSLEDLLTEVGLKRAKTPSEQEKLGVLLQQILIWRRSVQDKTTDQPLKL